MSITLPDDQKSWLEAQVAMGRYTSVEAAAAAAIAAAMADLVAVESDDLGWASPSLDAARTQAANGDVMTLGEYRAKLAARIATLER